MMNSFAKALVLCLWLCLGAGCAEEVDPNAVAVTSTGAAPDSAIGVPTLDAAQATPAPVPQPGIMTVPENFTDNANVVWESPFGPGGFWEAQAEPESVASAEESATGGAGFTTVVGAYFPPDENVVVFLGRTESGLPELDPRELADALAVALNSFMKQEAPGVSIDPTPDQLKRPTGKIEDGELMAVRYPGSGARTELGLMAFEADRLMKCLSFGKDNITKQPLTSQVPGYKNELTRLLEKPSDGRSWHRFWIEPAFTKLQYSPDGRTVIVDTKLAIQTRYMVNEGGKLVDAARSAEPAAMEFAQHLTDNYGDFAREFRAFHKLQAFSVVTSIAQAILGLPADAKEPQAVVIPFDPVAFVNSHRPQEVETPLTTPATVASLEQKKGNVTQTWQLTGGVDLGAKRDNTTKQVGDSLARSFGQAVQDRRQSQRANRNQSAPITVDGQSYQTHTVRYGTVRRASQQDLKVGDISVVRDLVANPDATQFGKHWQMRLPRLTESKITTKYAGGKTVPREVRFEDPEAGKSIALDKFGEMELPFGKGKYAAYFGDQQDLRLALASDAYMLFSGEISFSQDSRGNVSTVLGPQSKSVEFSPDAEHRVQVVRTASGERKFDYQAGQKSGQLLKKISDEKGNAVEFEYDNQDRVRQVKGSDGQSVSYHYDPAGRLFGLKRQTGDTLTYGFSNPSGEPRVASVRTVADSRIEARFTQGFLYTSGPRSGKKRSSNEAGPEPVKTTSPPPPPKVEVPPTVIKLVPSSSADRDFDVSINGQVVEFYGKLKGALDIAVDGGQDRQAQIDALKERFVDVARVSQGEPIQIDCPDAHVRTQLEKFIRAEVRAATPSPMNTPMPSGSRLASAQPEASSLGTPENVKIVSLKSLSDDGELIEMDINGEKVKPSRPLVDMLHSGLLDGDAAALQELAGLIKVQPGDQVLITCGEESLASQRDQLEQIWSKSLKDVKVQSTNDVDRAIQKITRKSGADLLPEVQVVIHESLNLGDTRSIYQYLMRLLGQWNTGGNKSRTLVLVAHNDRQEQALFKFLKDLADRGELVERDIFLVTCGNSDLSRLVSQLLSSAQARRIVHFSDPISQFTMAPFLSKLLPLLQKATAEGKPDVDWDELISTAVKQAQEEGASSNKPLETQGEPGQTITPLKAPAREDLEKLLLFNKQVRRTTPQRRLRAELALRILAERGQESYRTSC